MSPKLKKVEVNVSPFAILAAILFSQGKTAKVKVPVDDGGEPVEFEAPIMAVEKEGDALVCILPFQEIQHFMLHQYNMQLQIDEGVAVICFEKHQNQTQILNASGQAIGFRSDAISRLLNKLQGIDLKGDLV